MVQGYPEQELRIIYEKGRAYPEKNLEVIHKNGWTYHEKEPSMKRIINKRVVVIPEKVRSLETRKGRDSPMKRLEFILEEPRIFHKKVEVYPEIMVENHMGEDSRLVTKKE